MKKAIVKKPKSNEDTHYVNNATLFAAMKVYYEKLQKSNSKDVPICDVIGSAILLICENLSRKSNFGGYTYREDMVGEAVKDCVKGVKTFNPTKYDNPYGYFSMIAWHAMVRVILAEKKQTYLKHKNFQRMGIGAETLDEQNELSDDVIRAFEDKVARDKVEKKKKQTTKIKKKPVAAKKKVVKKKVSTTTHK